MSYQERNKIVKTLGYRSYKEYLKSDLWNSIRKRVLKRFRYKCSCCGKKAQSVHHNEYTRENLSGDALHDMVPVCNKCHYKIEFKKGKKRELVNASDSCKGRIKYKDKISDKWIKRASKVMMQDRKYHEEQAKRWQGYSTQKVKKKLKPIEHPLTKSDKLAIMVNEAQENREFYADEAEKWL